MQNREIKFRLWNGERMINAQDIDYLDLIDLQVYEGWRELEDGRGHEGTLLQYTGLKDRNGKEIYEGDIVKATYSKHREKDLILIQKVCFDVKSSGYSLEPLVPQEEIVFETTCNYCPLCWAAKIEIIGNIYENPELLTTPTNAAH